jgi:SSS family solute:Na+ symporter/sodium/proline symporter
MALELLPGFFVGMILAGIFAATMSTADSLVMSCSAAVTHDLLPERLEKPLHLKLATAAVTGLALAIALSDNRSVFQLVILSWSTLACAFAPILTTYSIGRRLSEPAAVGVMVLGVAVALTWRSLGLHETVYEGLPGILAGLLAASLLSRRVVESSSTGQSVRTPPPAAGRGATVLYETIDSPGKGG